MMKTKTEHIEQHEMGIAKQGHIRTEEDLNHINDRTNIGQGETTPDRDKSRPNSKHRQNTAKHGTDQTKH